MSPAKKKSLPGLYLRFMSEMMKTRMKENALMIIVIFAISVISVLFS